MVYFPLVSKNARHPFKYGFQSLFCITLVLNPDDPVMWKRDEGIKKKTISSLTFLLESLCSVWTDARLKKLEVNLCNEHILNTYCM
jgi:hypothetical protein